MEMSKIRYKKKEDFPVADQRKIELKGDFELNELWLPLDLIVKGKVVFDFRKGSRGAKILVGDGTELHNVEMAINGMGGCIEIGQNCKWKGFILCHGKGNYITIGKESTSIQSFIVARGEPVVIGGRCLFSREVEIRSSDSHKIYLKGTRDKINKCAPVVIGDHVWVGARSILSKGAKVASDSVVGAMSFVNREFESSNVVLAGAPAKIVKSGIEWER
jgi:acetyltransferase-like isoleucine patch superfamily enzyme